MTRTGTVYLLGAGPGDPRLMTLRGLQVLGKADVVFYDYLVNPELLRHAPPGAELVCLGRHGRGRRWEADEIHQRMVREAQRGRHVVRLKSGDSLVFGRASGEIDCLVQAGIPFEIVPGISAALAAASYAAIPLTDRSQASAVAFITGQEMSPKSDGNLDYRQLAHFPGTLVVYMGITTAANWTEQLMVAGMGPDRPVALVRRCSWPNQKVIRCRLDEVAMQVTPYSKFPPPAIAVIGPVAEERTGWNWFEQRPLFGQTVIITRPVDQAVEMQQHFLELGADTLIQPAIQIDDPQDNWKSLDQAISRLDTIDDLVFVSANGVDRFFRRLAHLRLDSRALAGIRIATVGPGTSRALAGYHVRSDLQPSEGFRAESLVDTLATSAQGRRMLLVRASRGRATLANGLAAAGAKVEQVVAYESRDVTELNADVAERIGTAGNIWVTVTSSAIAKAAVRLLTDQLPADANWASISPLTSNALRQAGVEPTVEAEDATIERMIDAMVGHCRKSQR